MATNIVKHRRIRCTTPAEKMGGNKLQITQMQQAGLTGRYGRIGTGTHWELCKWHVLYRIKERRKQRR